MDNRRIDDMVDAEAAVDVPWRLRIVSPKTLHDEELLRLHMLAGGRQDTFSPECVKVDLADKCSPSLIAAADVPNWFDGPPTVRRIVGLMRGRLAQIEVDKLPYWSVEHVHVDISVQQEKVREYLMRQLMTRVARRKTVEGVRVIVPPSDTDATARYMEQGFREAPMFDENGALIWHPAYRPY